jgi:hypothetical protein
MKPAAPDAGSRRRFLGAGIALIAAGVGAACGNGAVKRPPSMLEPVFHIAGGRIITRMDAAGGATLDALGSHVPLIFPVAVAASFNDVYIADAGASRLYRYDRALDAMAIMPDTRIGPTTRLQIGPDGSIYVLDAFSSEIRRFSRGGQQLPTLRPRLASSRYSNFVLDPLTAKAYAVDSAHLVIDEIQPMGSIAIEHLRIDEPGPIASDGRSLFLGSTRCGCVTEWIQGRSGRRFGAGKLRLPHAIALDGPRLYGIDAFDHGVSLLNEEGADSMTPAQLGMLHPESLFASNGLLYIADSAGRHVTAFRHGFRRPS